MQNQFKENFLFQEQELQQIQIQEKDISNELLQEKRLTNDRRQESLQQSNSNITDRFIENESNNKNNLENLRQVIGIQQQQLQIPEQSIKQNVQQLQIFAQANKSTQSLMQQIMVTGSQMNKLALQYILEYKNVKCAFMVFSIFIQVISLILGSQLTNVIGCLMYNINFLDQYFHQNFEKQIKKMRMSNCRKSIVQKFINLSRFAKKIQNLKDNSTNEIKKAIFIREKNFNFLIFGTFFGISWLLKLHQAFKVYE